MFRLITALILCLFVQGCVGVAVLKTRTESFEHPVVSDKAMACGLGHHDPGRTNATTYTATWLDTHWGKPATIGYAGEGARDEIRVYKFDRIWTGVVPVVLIPIPILLPIGREQVQFDLRDGQVVSGKQRGSHSVGGAFGFSAGPCTVNFGPFSMSD